MITKRFRLGGLMAALLALAMVAAACGGGDDDEPEPTNTPTATPRLQATATPTATPVPGTPTPTALPPGYLSKIEGWDQIAAGIETSMQTLYAKAIEEEGGELRIWGFSEIGQEIKDEFARVWPGMSISSRGLGFGQAAAIIQAVQAGAPTTDYTSGAITVWEAVFDRGMTDPTTDWAAVGVPPELLDPVFPGFVSTAVTGQHEIAFNLDCGFTADEVPNDPFEFLTDKWKNKTVSTASRIATGLSYYVLKHGEDRAKELALGMLDDYGHLLTSNAAQLSLTCDRPIIFPSTSDLVSAFTKGANIGWKPYDGQGGAVSFSGLMANAPHPNGAMLFILWDNFDREWTQRQLDDPKFDLPTIHPSLPGSETYPINVVALQGQEQGFQTWLTNDNKADRRAALQFMRDVVLNR